MNPGVLVWTIASLIGLAITSYGVLEAIRDMQALRREHIANGRRMVALQRLVAQSSRMTIFIIWTITVFLLVSGFIEGAGVVIGLITSNILTTIIAASDAAVGRRLRHTD